MKRILVPTDRSPNAERAVDYAIQLFAGEEVLFTLFQSYDIPAYAAEMPVPIEHIGEDVLLRILDEDASRLRQRIGSEKFTFQTRVSSGSLAINIESAVAELNIDMVVMGTKGASGVAATLIGSNTSDVIQAATCPVLAVPESAGVSSPKHILFATDNKGLSDPRILDPLLDIARKFDAHVHLMNVMDEGKVTSVDEAVEGLRLDHLLQGVDHTFAFENSNDKAHAIEDYLNSHNIDLLAVIPRRNNFFDAIFHRSVTRKLSLHTKVPMLSMHDLG